MLVYFAQEKNARTTKKEKEWKKSRSKKNSNKIRNINFVQKKRKKNKNNTEKKAQPQGIMHTNPKHKRKQSSSNKQVAQTAKTF